MPEIDTDTFQVIALALSGIALLVSLLVLSAVSKLRKDIGEKLTERATQPTSAATTRDQEPRRERESHETVPQTQSAQPIASATAGAQAETTQPVSTTAGGAAADSAEDLPVEQPFERDGRWWYKRGDELLVYDEGSGQWQPAPAGSLSVAGTAAGSPSAETAYTSVAEAAPKASAGEGDAPADAASGFWKCPSCGAVNGATAASCRMCFTAKP